MADDRMALVDNLRKATTGGDVPGSSRTIGGLSEALINAPLIADIGRTVTKRVLPGFPP